jgi:hypothetical protein
MSMKSISPSPTKDHDTQESKDMVLADPVANMARQESPMFTVLSWIMNTELESLSLEEQIKLSAVLKFLMSKADDTRSEITSVLKSRFEDGDLEGLVLKESATGKSASIDIQGLRVQYMRPTLSDNVDPDKLEQMFEEKGLEPDEAVKSVTIKIKGKTARESMDLVRQLKEKGAKVSVDYDATLLRTMAKIELITIEEAESLLKQSVAGSRVICTLTPKASKAVSENISMTSTVGKRDE